MGAGSHISRALIATVAIQPAGCIDFVAPDLPQIGGPAVFQAAIHADGDGTLRVDAELEPGIDRDGFRRTVPSAAMIVLGDSIQPDDVEPDGTRSYVDVRVTDPGVLAGPLSLEAPVVDGVDPPPAIRWSGIVRLDPDTIHLIAGADLSLRTQTAGADEPVPDNSSWTLLLRSGDKIFRIGADGAPPPLIRVPVEWLPGENGRITADLSYLRTHSISGTTSYIGVFLVSLTVRWTIVRMTAEQSSAGHRGAFE